ncbi:hypothetical protein Sjap_002506 [Stephania japonica]|uniref:Uncharacterized protein n=1 Tax=Stephania japonica TaxID=461633 RepID=A0AAP0KM78_9MAGN
MNNVMHLASRFGQLELVHEIIKLSLEMVSSYNHKLEMSLHETCREGHCEVTMALLNAKPSEAYKLNRENESSLFVACGSGRWSTISIVSHLLLNYSFLLTFEEDESCTSLHSAASVGHTGTWFVMVNADRAETSKGNEPVLDKLSLKIQFLGGALDNPCPSDPAAALPLGTLGDKVQDAPRQGENLIEITEHRGKPMCISYWSEHAFGIIPMSCMLMHGTRTSRRAPSNVDRANGSEVVTDLLLTKPASQWICTDLLKRMLNNQDVICSPKCKYGCYASEWDRRDGK